MKAKRIWQYVGMELPLWLIGLLTCWMPENPLSCKLRGFLSRPFFKKCGKNFQYGARVRFLSPHGIEIGDNVYIASDCWLGGGGGLVIEDEILFGPFVMIATGVHTFVNGSARFGPARRAPVRIGRGSWLAAHVVVNAGVTVGKGNLVGANAVVTKDTPDDVLVAGIPGRVVRPRKDS